MTPNPGSREAVAAGCICNPRDNRYGRGDMEYGPPPMFVVTIHCPLHCVGSRWHSEQLEAPWEPEEAADAPHTP